MTAAAIPSVADVLIELHRRGIEVSIRGDRFGLRPVGKAPNWLKATMRQLRTELMTLLADPRRRWRQQADVLIAGRASEQHEDLVHVFDEREAIASVDGGLNDHDAGQRAYETLCNHLREIDG